LDFANHSYLCKGLTADFSTHIYQQDFHVAPNPKKIIQLDAPGEQGRYVRVQLLDKNYLSLAEVQVINPLFTHLAIF
jgi:hypothetical protein